MNSIVIAITELLVVLSLLAAPVFDFELSAPGSFPEDWSVAMTHDGGAPRWEIRVDTSSPAGSKVLVQVSDDATSGRFPLAIYENASVADGEIRVKFKPVSGRIDQAAGLVWRYTDKNNYYVVRANALEDNIVLYKVEGGRRSSLAPVGRPDAYGVGHTVADQQWSTLGVRFDGPRFTVYFDGRELFEVEDRTFAGAGKVGLWTKADSVTYFDDFEVITP
jgi:hypothetical protein